MKTAEKIKELHSHDHAKAGGGLDQAALIADAETLMALWKAGVTECTGIEKGEWTDEKGKKGFSLHLKGVVVKD